MSKFLLDGRAVTLVAQGEDWHISPNIVNHSQSGNVFMLGACHLVPRSPQNISLISTHKAPALQLPLFVTTTSEDTLQPSTFCCSLLQVPSIARRHRATLISKLRVY
jgi:hypothetical protein